MQSLQQQIQVSFRYDVHFTTDLFSPTNRTLVDGIEGGSMGGPARMLVVVDEGVAAGDPCLLPAVSGYFEEHSARLHLVRPPILMEGGERIKNDPGHLERLHAAIHDAALDRHSYVAAVGGGALLDLVGYAAATAHRGVRLLRIPTTTLAQADSAVGVKNSMNAFGKKNFLGTFTPPYAVFNDLKFLETLPRRDWRGGIAEAVKVALIKDADFFLFMEENAGALDARDMALMQRLIHRCAEMHLQHIATSGDPFEYGSSRPLDFGHWSAHKLEQLTGYEVRHGEAVALGIALDSTYSHLSGFLPEADWKRILDTLSTAGFALYAPELGEHLGEPGHPRNVLHGLEEFREHLGGQLTIMLLRRIGEGFEVHEMDESLVRESIHILRSRFESGASSGSEVGSLE